MSKEIKILIIALSILLVLIIFYILKNIKDKKNIDKLLNDCNNNRYKIYKDKHKLYDYALRFIDFDIYIKIAKVQKHSQICINSKETWRLSWNAFETQPGKTYTNDRYMDELVNFLNKDIKTNRKYLKVILLYKEVEGIVRYLNETELDCININSTPYGYKISTYNTFNDDINIIIDYCERELK